MLLTLLSGETFGRSLSKLTAAEEDLCSGSEKWELQHHSGGSSKPVRHTVPVSSASVQLQTNR
jgi:hypothetical protein